MARGTGVFMPRSYEDVTTSSSKLSSFAGQRQPQTCSGSTGHEGRSTSYHAPRSDRGGSAEGSSQEFKALARVGTTSHSSNTRSGITLRRVPWGSAQGSGSSSSSGITSRHSSSGTLTLTVGSCPDTSSVLLRQPPPPPPVSIAAAARHQAIRRSSTASSGSASPSPAAAPAVLAHMSSSDDGLVVRQHLPSPGYELRPPAALQVPPAPRLSACGWEDIATTPGAAADACLPANTLWAFSPGTQAAAAADGLFELPTDLRSSSALTLDATTNSSSSMTPPAGRRALQLEGSVDVATALQQQQHIFSAAAAVNEVSMHSSAAAAGPWAAQSLDLSLSSSFHSCPLLTLMPTPTATAALPAGSSPTVHSSGSLVSAAAGGSSWMGPVLLGQQPYDSEDLVLQDTLLLSGSLDPGGFMGGAALSTAHLVQQQQHSNGLLHQADMEWDVLPHNTPPGGGGGPLSAVLAAPAAPTATPAAAAAAAQRSAFAQAAVCRAPSLLDGCGSGLGLLPGYPDALHSTASLHQALQLANSSLGFTTSCPAPAAAKSSVSAPISIPAALGRTQGMQATAAAVQQGAHTPSVLQPQSADTTHAVAVAQLKLQQLMAVECIQQQLQVEVIRLLPLI